MQSGTGPFAHPFVPLSEMCLARLVVGNQSRSPRSPRNKLPTLKSLASCARQISSTAASLGASTGPAKHAFEDGPSTCARSAVNAPAWFRSISRCLQATSARPIEHSQSRSATTRQIPHTSHDRSTFSSRYLSEATQHSNSLTTSSHCLHTVVGKVKPQLVRHNNGPLLVHVVAQNFPARAETTEAKRRAGEPLAAPEQLAWNWV
jgi:hypothetical protein